jgi:hypothetical protein
MPEELLEEFATSCKAVLADMFRKQNDKFTLRMSNIGRDARQLYLASKYYDEAEPLAPEVLVRMTYGHIIEKMFVVLLKAAGVEVDELNEKVKLQLDTMVLNGEYDIKIGGKHYDFKSASDWSYTNKFASVEAMMKEDSFGYVGQAIAYAEADKTPFGGWFAINKSTGDFKVVEGDILNKLGVRKEYIQKFNYNIRVVNELEPVPPCTGVEKETYYKKESGNKVLGSKCKFCVCKQKCHPGIQYKPSVVSKASPKPWVWYVELNNETFGDK